MRRADVEKKVAAFVDTLAVQVADILGAHVDQMLERARDHAMAQLKQDIAGATMTTPARAELESKVETRPRRAKRTPIASKVDRREAIAAAAEDLPKLPGKLPTPIATFYINHDDELATAKKTPGKASCSNCGQPGHNARTCGRSDD